MSYSTIELTIEGPVATVWLARPDKHNAMNAMMMDEITQAFKTLEILSEIHVCILRSKAKTFCAGGDLGWMQSQITANRAGKIKEAKRLAYTLKAIDQAPFPVIALVDGNCFGGGIGIMSVADIAIATPDIKLSLSETRLGLIPATIGPYVLRRIGESNMRDLTLTARVFDGTEAYRLGLAHRLTDAPEQTLQAELDQVLQTQPSAIKAAKISLRSLRSTDVETEIETSVNALADLWELPETQTRIAKFLEKKS